MSRVVALCVDIRRSAFAPLLTEQRTPVWGSAARYSYGVDLLRFGAKKTAPTPVV